MAEIDKALPNVKQKLNIPNPEEVQVEEEKALVEQQGDKPIDVQQNEDGSVDINFDPSIGSVEQSGDHFANSDAVASTERTTPPG